MTKDEILSMAMKSGIVYNQSLNEFNTPFSDGVYLDDLADFAALVAEKEREACAKVCEADAFVEQWKGLSEAAKRIRARGNK
jgi:hypothetical protein